MIARLGIEKWSENKNINTFQLIELERRIQFKVKYICENTGEDFHELTFVPQFLR